MAKEVAINYYAKLSGSIAAMSTLEKRMEIDKKLSDRATRLNFLQEVMKNEVKLIKQLI